MHEYFITKYSVEVINDIIFYPILSIVVFGFMTLYMVGFTGQVVAGNILTGFILWQVINITVYSIAVGCLWDVWSRNLTNIFITPISITEYLISYTFSGALKSLLVVVLATILSAYVFHFNLISFGLVNLVIYFINLAGFGFGFGIIVLGLIFRYGTRVQALSWGLLNIFQPLMAVVYPVTVLPKSLQAVAYIFPPTYIFEAARINIVNQTIQWDLISKAFLLNLIFIMFAIAFFNFMFARSKKLGQFARLEG
jgi:ABC-2 type transport system permease protein